MTLINQKKLFSDKTILITGSSSGIGAAVARLAVEYGADVILHGKTESRELKKLAKELKSEYIFCDVAKKSVVKSKVQKIMHRVKRIDVLINCVGMAVEEFFLQSEDDVWIKVFEGNLFGAIHFSQAVIPSMIKWKYGRIVNISSVRGHSELSSEGRPAYSAAKAAVINLTAVLAKTYAPHILVNCVSPGFTNTKLSKLWSEKSRKKSVSNLLGRVLEPKEIAEPILFLGSEKNTVITGQTLLVDGGYSLSGK